MRYQHMDELDYLIKKKVDKKKEEGMKRDGTLRDANVDQAKGEVDPTTIIKTDTPERKLEIQEQGEGRKLEEKILQIRR